ncbi:MAG: sortase domain-bontaining protein [Dehalococcoidia bacterium]
MGTLSKKKIAFLSFITGIIFLLIGGLILLPYFMANNVLNVLSVQKPIQKVGIDQQNFLITDNIINNYSNNSLINVYHPKSWTSSRWLEINYELSNIQIHERFSSEILSNLSISNLNGTPTKIKIPYIEVDSKVENLKVISINGVQSFDSPKNIIGRIPNEFLGSKDATGWYFGHLESPIKGEGNIFQELPKIADAIRNGDPVFIHLISDNYHLVYEAYSSEEIHEDDLKIFNPGLEFIKLVTCSNRPFYDYRQIITAKIVGEIKK